MFDAAILALLNQLDVPLPTEHGDFDADLDLVFGTPLDLHEPAGSAREMRRYAAAVLAVPPGRRHELALAHGAEIAARVDAARDILASDPGITTRVRERLVDILLPHATQLQLRITRPAVEPVLRLAS
ncbi:hypothetical protein [Streptomyces sp. NPDC088557]|uniref:hypothetical protein n=1 Tax=Streptomyces sp. NPDC088557 TaxID=3365867 RepID=UPI0038099F9D